MTNNRATELKTNEHQIFERFSLVFLVAPSSESIFVGFLNKIFFYLADCAGQRSRQHID